MSTLMDDAIEMLSAIQAGITAAMPAVGEEIKACIAEHIQDEIYITQSAVYPRSNTLLNGILEAAVNADASSVSVNYLPYGERPGTWASMPEAARTKYGKMDDDPIKPNPVSGDALIRRIETGSYDYKTKIGARPFLTNAVQDLIEGGRILNAFIGAFNSSAGLGLQAVDKQDQEVSRTGDDFGGFA